MLRRFECQLLSLRISICEVSRGEYWVRITGTPWHGVKMSRYIGEQFEYEGARRGGSLQHERILARVLRDQDLKASVTVDEVLPDGSRCRVELPDA